jgi:hypothetical protein
MPLPPIQIVQRLLDIPNTLGPVGSTAGLGRGGDFSPMQLILRGGGGIYI